MKKNKTPKFCSDCGAPSGQGASFCGECGQCIPPTVSNSSESARQVHTTSLLPKKRKVKTILIAAIFILIILGGIAVLVLFQEKKAQHYTQENSIDSYDIVYPDDFSEDDDFATVVEKLSSDEYLAALSSNKFLSESRNNDNVTDDFNSSIPPEPSLDSSKVFFSKPPTQ